MRLKEEAAGCMLCENARCSLACPNGFDPARAVRAIRFDNESCAAEFVGPSCAECEGLCEKACIRIDRPVGIRKMLSRLEPPGERKPVDLSIDFLGVHCENPFFLSSSIVAGSYDMCAAAFERGWAGAVYKTIGFFTPEEVSPRFDTAEEEGGGWIGLKNLEQISDHPLEENLDAIRRLKENYPDKVIIASIMGQTDDEWVRLSRLVTEAKADIIECNFSCPHMTGDGLGSDVGQNPELVRRYTALVKGATHLPVLAKMTPNTGNMEPAAVAAVRGGADGIAAINTVKSLMGFDLERMEPYRAVHHETAVSGYSGRGVKPIALRFISDLAHCRELEGVPLSGMGGIETWHDAAEFISLGCGTVQVTTAVMEYGYRIIDDLTSGLAAYMERRGLKRVSELVGASLSTVVPPDVLDRGTVSYPVIDRTGCLGCGRCYVSCRDAGHQAIVLSSDGKPSLAGGRCVGCHLCLLVCPTHSISSSRRVRKITSGEV